MPLKHRLALVIGMYAFLLAMYLGSQWLIRFFGLSTSVNLLLPGEDRIPFLPFGFWIYVLLYILPVWLVVMVDQKHRVKKIILTFGITIIIHTIIFLVFPVEYVLRPKVGTEGFGVGLAILMYNIDSPLNNFPSMHVSFSFIFFFFVRRYLPQYRLTALFLAIVISASTLIVKQHYVLDIVSGFLLAWAVNGLLINSKRISS